MKKKLVKETLRNIEILSLGAIRSASSDDKNLAKLLYKINYLIDIVDSEREYNPLLDALEDKYGSNLFPKKR